MKIRFQADADFNQEILDGLIRKEPLIDFQTAHEAGLTGLPDEEVLKIAAKNNRILVSHDRRTMPTHFADFIQKQNSPGVFIISQSLAIGLAIDALLLIWAASEQDEWENFIVDLPL
jgi:predicted nuclease of predicted toxin-antitoxin system